MNKTWYEIVFPILGWLLSLGSVLAISYSIYAQFELRNNGKDTTATVTKVMECSKGGHTIAFYFYVKENRFESQSVPCLVFDNGVNVGDKVKVRYWECNPNNNEIVQ